MDKKINDIHSILLQDLISEIDKTAQIITTVKIFKRVHFLNEDNCKT